MRRRRLPVVMLLLQLQASALFAADEAPKTPKKQGFTLSNLQVDVEQIREGGPKRDAIRSVDAPQFLALPEATWVQRETDVLGVQIGSEARAYPVRMLDYHQIVNDVIGDAPIVVSYDPLAGSPLVFSRRVAGKTLSFGVSGLLYNHNFLMFDRETESLWSQFQGRAIAGPLAGKQLERLPVRQEAAGAWIARVGETRFMRHPDPEHIPYQISPYSTYWIQDRILFPVHARDERFHSKELVLGVVVEGKPRAYLGSIVTREGGKLDERIRGKRIQVRYASETGTFDWDVDPGVEVTEAYWLAWKAFHPDTEIWRDEP